MENKRLLIGLDLDGTLLKDNKTISFKTRRYLKKLEKKGHYIVLCSGRAPRTMLHFYAQIGLKSPLISYNGALIHDPMDPSFKKIGFKINKDFITSFYKNTINQDIIGAFAENEHTIYSDSNDHFLFAFFEKGNLRMVNGPLTNIDEDCYVFVMKTKDYSDELKERVYKYAKENANDYELRFWWDCPYCEFHVKGVSKAHSLKLLADKLNINYDNVLVFGDADNDIEMLSTFKNSFLMKNGNPKLKEYARYVTKKDNNHNGVIASIKEFLKKNNLK